MSDSQIMQIMVSKGIGAKEAEKIIGNYFEPTPISERLELDIYKKTPLDKNQKHNGVFL